MSANLSHKQRVLEGTGHLGQSHEFKSWLCHPQRDFAQVCPPLWISVSLPVTRKFSCTAWRDFVRIKWDNSSEDQLAYIRDSIQDRESHLRQQTLFIPCAGYCHFTARKTKAWKGLGFSQNHDTERRHASPLGLAMTPPPSLRHILGEAEVCSEHSYLTLKVSTLTPSPPANWDEQLDMGRRSVK